MKKKLLIACIQGMLFATGAVAQITINSSNFASPGEIIVNAFDSITVPATTVVPGPGGANQTWNFTALHAHVIDSIHAVLPGSTTDGAMYPSATMALTRAGGQEAYFANTGSGVYTYGGSSPVGDPGNHMMLTTETPASLYMQWPSTYGTTYADNYATSGRAAYSGITGYDSVKISYHTTCTVIMDAWGTIQTPTGTFPCLRQKRHDCERDSVWIHHMSPAVWAPFSPTIDTVDTYTWWTNGTLGKYPIALQKYVYSSRRYGPVQWLYSIGTVGIEEHSDESAFVVFPNPASDYIDIMLQAGASFPAVTLMDMSGRKILSKEFQGMSLIRLETDTLQNGMYFLVLNGTDGKQHVKKVCITR